jgi:hypothetical protein
MRRQISKAGRIFVFSIDPRSGSYDRNNEGRSCAALLRSRTLAPLLVLIALSVTATPALAGYSTVTGTFGEPCNVGENPCGPGKFKEPTSLAVNDEKEDVYVLDSGNDRIEAFNEKHEFQFEFNGSGDNLAVEGKAAPTGKFLQPENIAVDNSCASQKPALTESSTPETCKEFDPSNGDVYVADSGHSVIDKFSATGKYEGQIIGSSATGKGAIASGSNRIEGVTTETGVFVVGQEINSNAIEAGTTITHVEEESPGVFNLEISTNLRVVDGGQGPETVLLTASACTGNVAVDTSGNVFVADRYQVCKFNATGTFEEQFPINEAVRVAGGFAVDSSDDLFASAGSRKVNEYVAGTHEQVVLKNESEPASSKETLAIVGANGLLVDEGSLIEVFQSPFHSEASLPLQVFPSEGLSESAGVAVNGAKGEGTLYASQRALDDVEYYAPGAPKAPEVISESASTEEEFNEGRFAAEINPNEQETTYVFEYSTEVSANGKELQGTIEMASGEPIPATFGGQTVKVHAKEQEIAATYYYRVVATNGTGTTTGKVQAYTKLPIVEGESAPEPELTLTSATLQATINPDWVPNTKYHFEYAPGTPAGKKLVEEGKGTPIPGGEVRGQEFTGLVVNSTIGGLNPYTTYYYRVVAENKSTENPQNADKGVPVVGEVEKFTTRSLPITTTGEAADITRTSATLSGTVIAPFVKTTYYYEYISKAGFQYAIAHGAADPEAGEAAYQNELAEGAPSPYAEGETTSPVAVTPSEVSQPAGPILVGGLLPQETYHYRLVAKNQFGWEYGKDGTFTTAGKTLPTVSTGGASAVSQNVATLSGTVTTNGLQTNYGFEIGTSPGDYGPATGLGAIGGAATEEVHVTLGELQPGTTYYYRVTATNADGTEKGQPGVFTTPGFPTLLVAPASLPLIAAPNIAFPKEEKASGTTTKALTNKEKLSKALKACKRDKSKSKRAKCEKAAQNKYPVAAKKKTKKK